MIAGLISFLLRKNLSIKSKTALVNAVIDRLGVPLHAIISTDDNRRILIQGKQLSIEQTELLFSSAVALKDNYARKLVRDHVRFMAVDLGYLQSKDPEVQLFYKAALWFAQEEDRLIDSLTGS